jgi:CDGSH-type Zn-finger protein
MRRVPPPLGMESTARANVTINVRRHGPHLVSGPVELHDADRNDHPAEDTVVPCRCGASTKPFSDGTHSKPGFRASERAVPGSAER